MPSPQARTLIQRYVAVLQKFTDRYWYPPFIGLLAALDNVLIIIPNDGILISSSMLTPKRWFTLALNVAIGSTIGALMLASFIEILGLPWIFGMYPGIELSKTWQVTHDFFHEYGMIVIFIVAITPIMQQPAVILASLAETPLLKLGLVIFTGRFIKFLIMAYVGSHAPRLLEKMWGVKGELDEAGIDVHTKR